MQHPTTTAAASPSLACRWPVFGWPVFGWPVFGWPVSGWPVSGWPVCSRKAFTLVELLVVITIIGILMSLLMPAVQQVREAGRRVQCTNNMRQIGLAILSYETLGELLPPAGAVEPAPQNTGGYVYFKFRTGSQLSWVVFILPQLEQQALYDHFDRTETVYQQPNEPQAQEVPTFLCPTDAASGRRYEYQGKQFAKGNYAAWTSPYHVDFGNFWPGALIGHRPHPMAAIRDGGSQTLLLGEVRTREHPQDERGVWALPWTGASLLAFDAHPTPGGYPVNGQKQQIYYYDGVYSAGFTQVPNSFGGLPTDVLYDCPDSAGAQLENMPCSRYSGYWSAAPRSLHPGGVNVVYLDGHVGFLPNGIDETTMANLVSVNDGQITELPE